MTANNSRSFLANLNNLEIGTYPKSPEFKVGDRVKISKYKNFLVKDTLKIGERNI